MPGGERSFEIRVNAAPVRSPSRSCAAWDAAGFFGIYSGFIRHFFGDEFPITAQKPGFFGVPLGGVGSGGMAKKPNFRMVAGKPAPKKWRKNAE